MTSFIGWACDFEVACGAMETSDIGVCERDGQTLFPYYESDGSGMSSAFCFQLYSRSQPSARFMGLIPLAADREKTIEIVRKAFENFAHELATKNGATHV